MQDEPRTWILTGSPENFAATREHGFALVNLKEGRRRLAEQMLPGDRVVFYLTRVAGFGGSVRLVSDMFEDRTPVWPGKPGSPDPYPWRFRSRGEIVLDDGVWVPAEDVRTRLEHVRKWPAEHWRLAFQGQLRSVSGSDAAVLVEALHARAGDAA